jgi:hypothetical protein
MILALAGSAWAAERPASTAQLIDMWGSVKYCRAIYAEPQLRSRVYAGDHASCEKAEGILRDLMTSDYPVGDWQHISLAAEQKAAAIRYNTRSVNEAVTACRQQCRAIENLPEERENTGG